MPEVQYPFIDLAVHERVREAFAAGMAVAIFTPELDAVCWANGRGAQLFGFSSIYDFLDQGIDRSDLMFRQVEPVARSLKTIDRKRTFTVRITSGFSRIAVQATCEMIRFQGKACVMLALPVDIGRLSLAERAARLIEGLDDPETHMAVLDGDGGVLAASGEFAALDISIQTARMMLSMVGNDRNRLVKRQISTASGYLPAAIGTVSEDPALHLLFVVGMATPGVAGSVVPAVLPLVAPEPTGDDATSTASDAAPQNDYEEALDAVAAIEENPEAEEEISLEEAAADTAAEHETDADPAGAEEPDAPHDNVTDEDAKDDSDPADQAPGTEPAGAVVEEQTTDTSDAPEDETEDDNTGGTETAVAEQAAAPMGQRISEGSIAPQPAQKSAARQIRTVRFVWKIDAGGHFSEISREFAEAVGPHAADITGMAFSDLAALFNLDPEGKIAELLGRRDTWSGKTIWWPVEGTSLVVPVDLAALPTYTRTREFDGFRGFGIVRLADAANDPNAAGLALGSGAREMAAASSLPPANVEVAEGNALAPEDREQAGDERTVDEQADDETKAAIAANENELQHADDTDSTDELPTGEKPALKLVETPNRRQSDKVIQLEEHRSRLSPGEQAAFQEIGRQLDTIARSADETEDAKADEPDAITAEADDDLETAPSNEEAQFEGAQDDARDDEIPETEEREAEELSPSSLVDVAPLDAIEDEAEREYEQAPGDQTDDGELNEEQTEETGLEETSPNEAAASEIGEETQAEQEVSTEDEASSEGEMQDAEDLPAVPDEMADEAKVETPDDAAATDETPGEAVAEAEEAAVTEEPARSADVEAYASALSGRERIGLSAEIIDQMPVALLVHAGDTLIHANPEFLTLTGYGSLEALSDVGGLDALLQRQELEGKASEAGGMVVVRADDAIVPVTARLQSIRWNDAAALMLALMPAAALESVDTEETETEVLPLHPLRTADQLAKLQVEVEELRAILETATDGVVIIGSGGEVRSINRAASALFNFDDEEVTGQPFVTLFAHESQRAVIDYLGGLSGHGVASVLNDGREVIGREASGGFIPLFMTIGRLTSSNGFCAVIRDITQWKRTEDELRAAKRAAETANAHKSEFLAHVSHEIRTPLNAIIGFADMMGSERLGPVGHPRYVEYANDIGRSGRHVLDIVNDLLDISKIEAGELDLDFAAVGLNETVSEAVSLVQPQANGQRVIIRTALSQAVPQVVADLRSIKQIVLNILSNAIRFTPSGGQIVVSTAYEANGSVVLRIRDTGIGMSRAELELAMKPFRQVPGASRNRGDGTGLGLPLTKAMVDANRANFNITSAPNEGTLVEVTFPSQRVLAS